MVHRLVLRSLTIENNHFEPHEKKRRDSFKVLYLSAIGALTHLTYYTRCDIFFIINLLIKLISSSTWRHWNETKQVLPLWYYWFRVYPKNFKYQMVNFSDVSQIHTRPGHKHVHYWRHRYIMKFLEENVYDHFFKSCWNHRTSWK